MFALSAPTACPCPANMGRPWQAYDIYKTVGGNTELRQTVDGLRATLADGEDPHHIGGVFFGSC